MSAPRRWSLPLLVGGLALALTGCLKVDMDLQVNTDGNVDGTMVVAVSDQLFELGGLERDDLFDDLSDSFDEDELPDGASAETSVYDEDGFYGVRIVLADVPAEQLSDTSGVGGEDDDFSLTREDDTFVFHGVLDFSEQTGGDGDDNPFGDAVLDDAQGRIRIQFPGEVLDHNGDLDGTTVTWELSFTEPNVMEATSRTEGGASGGGDDDDGGGSAVGAIIAVLVVAAVVAGIVVFVRSRKGKGDGGPPPPPVVAGAPPPAPGTFAPGPFAPPAPPPTAPPGGTLPPPPPPPT